MMDTCTQKAIWKLRFRSKTYANAARQEDAHCNHCDSDVSCICDHWLHDCPAMAVHHIRLRAYLQDEHKHFRGKQLSTALLNSQVKVKHRDLTLLLRRYLFTSRDWMTAILEGHPHNLWIVGRLFPPPGPSQSSWMPPKGHFDNSLTNIVNNIVYCITMLFGISFDPVDNMKDVLLLNKKK